jgi:signal transduction histidine kinase
VIGVLVLGSLDGRTPEEDDLALLTELCRPVAAAVENAVLYGDLRRVDGTRKMLLTRLVQAQEEERTAIANDIHDDSVQVMTAVSMRLDLLRKQLQDPDERASLLGLAETVRAAINRLRGLMFELHPPALDRDGLAAVLRQSLQRVADEAGVVATFEHHLGCEPVAETRIIVYRIAQEALANVRKHARAQSVKMQLEEQGGGIITRIRDDGDGFDAERRVDSPAGHMGLTAMRERAELAGGWLKVGSSPGAGTSVEFWLPQTGTGG